MSDAVDIGALIFGYYCPPLNIDVVLTCTVSDDCSFPSQLKTSVRVYMTVFERCGGF